jgi:Zn finger protein HypA/HybF involved in hydrogenase expression
MKKSLCALLLLITVSFLSCDKEELTYTIKGTISDEFTRSNISNVVVDLYQKVYINNVLSDNYTFIGSTKTNALGEYSFEIPRDKIYEIKMDLINSQYYDKSVIYSSSNLTTANDNVFNEKLESKSWVKIIIKNPFIEPDEQLNIYKSNFKEGCEDCCANGGQSFFETGDTTFKCPTVGGQEVTINYGQVGSTAQFTVNVVCEPFDTTNVTIQY